MIIRLLVIVSLVVIEADNVSFVQVVVFDGSIRIIRPVCFQLFPADTVPGMIGFLFATESDQFQCGVFTVISSLQKVGF